MIINTLLSGYGILSAFVNLSALLIGSDIYNKRYDLGYFLMLIGGTSVISLSLLINILINHSKLFTVRNDNTSITYYLKLIFYNMFGTILYVISHLVLTTYSIDKIYSISDTWLYDYVIFYYCYTYASILIVLIYLIVHEHIIKKENMKNNYEDLINVNGSIFKYV